MKIKVQSIRKIKGESAVKAFANVDVNDISINGVKVIKAKDGELFVALPTNSYEKDGETKYSAVVFIKDADTYEALQEKVLAAYKTAGKKKAKPVDDDEPWED